MKLKIDDKVVNSITELSKELNILPQEAFDLFLQDTFNDWRDVYLVEHRLKTFEDGGTLEDIAKKNNLDY